MNIQPNEWIERFDKEFPFPAQNISDIDSDNNRLKTFIESELQRVRLEAYEQGIKDGEKYESTSNQINNSKLH